MKLLYFIVFSLLINVISFSQEYNFEDGTLQGWTNIDGSTDLLTILEEGSLYLQNECDGSNTPIGQMAIATVVGPFIGDNYGDGFNIFGVLVFWMKNENDFDLHLRLGFRGGDDNTIIVSTDPLIIPANSGWSEYHMTDIFSNTTILSGTNSIFEVQEDTVEMRIIHNESISFEGQPELGFFKIDELSGIYLGSNDFNKVIVSLYPNPVVSSLTVVLSTVNEATIEIYNILGNKVLSQRLDNVQSRIDLSALQSGMYLVKITSEEESIIRKIVKN